MRLNTREGPILASALALLDLRGWPAWRSNSGMLMNPQGRLVRFGIPGCSDILAIVPKSGRLCAIETKRPGGKPTAPQSAFLAAVERAGGVALVIDDVAVLARALDLLAADPFARLGLDGEPIECS